MPGHIAGQGKLRRDKNSKAAGRLARVGVLLVFSLLSLPAQGAGNTSLKLLISVENQSIETPFPARVTLHLHNAGNETVWLYRHARGTLPGPRPRLEEDTAPRSTGASAIDVKLEPASAGNVVISNPAQGTAFERVGLPKPTLVRLGPGEDYEEKATIRLAPALSDVQKPLWGTYRLSLTYKAQYSNAEEIQRNLKITVWQGEVSSNSIEVQLQAPGPQSRGQISGTVNTPDSAPIREAIVSLTDQAQHLTDQTTSDPEGRYSFSGLPPGLYWITARRDGATEDTTVFRHVDLTASQPSVTQELVLIPPEVYEAKKLLHKPVLFMVTDSAGRPLGRVGLEATWSNGPVLDSVKGETGDDGVVELDLIPGRSFVTLKRRGCPKQDERADVAAGEGIDGFSYTLECTEKSSETGCVSCLWGEGNSMANQHSPAFLALVQDAKRRIRETNILELKKRLDTKEQFFLIDVREDHEWAAGRIPGAIHLGKGIIERDIEEKIPNREAEILLYCGGGFRSALAADNLQKMGYRRVVSVDGGWRAWVMAGYPVAKDPP